MKKITLLLTVLFLNGFLLKANNIQTANIKLFGQNTSLHTNNIKYDISWENSWRTSTNEANYDGAWCFIKFKKVNTSEWKHCTISTMGMNAATGSTIKVSADNKGLWQYRSANGIGNVSWLENSVVWQYGTDGVLDSDSVEIKLFAIEMVQVPAGQFYLGSGGSGNYEFHDASSTTLPFSVVSESAITCGGTTLGNLNNLSTAINGEILATFPKGFAGFWVAKYEASRQQYADFLNNIDYAKAVTNGLNSGVFAGTHPNATVTFPERASIDFTEPIMKAWLDWAAMRPISEMEFEKACRGKNISPIANEYAWGNTTINGLLGVTNQGAINEAATGGNCNYNQGYLTRVGLFATATTAANRVASGASYYGILDMSGNAWERVAGVGVNNIDSDRAFTGSIHGDGVLAATGTHNIGSWAGPIRFRGGSFNNPSGAGFARISDRYYTINYINLITAAAGSTARAARTEE